MNGNRILGGADAGRLRDLVDAIDAVIYEADLAGWVKFVNRRAVDLLGYPQERWLSQPSFWQAITYCEDRPKVIDHFALCARDGQRRELEYRLVAADGQVVWVRESLAASLEGPADDHLLRAVMWKIDRPRKADDQLLIARRQLAEQLADMTHLHDLSQLLWATPELEPLLQEILAAVVAIQGADMGMVRIYDPARRTMEIAAHIGLPKQYIERYGLAPPGDVACGLAMERGRPLIIDDVDAEESGSPYREPARIGGYRAKYSTLLTSRSGELIGAIATCFRESRRPTPREICMVELFARQAADFIENARLKSALKEADRQKDNALATLAHEIRNPLSVITNAAFILQTALQDNPKAVEFCTVISQQASFMSHLAADLIETSRIARGEAQLQPEVVDVRTCMENASAAVRALVEERSQRLALFPPPEPITLAADPIRLQQILVNLLINAARYTGAGGLIILKATREGDAVVFRVQDTGVGIQPEMLSRIFEPFVRGDGDAESRGDGLGLGLTLVKRLVERHRGTVSATSAGPGKGSEFAVRLPLY